MQKEQLYKNFIYFGALVLLLDFFISLYFPHNNSVLDFVFNLIWIIAAIFVYFLFRKIIIFIGLIFITIEFNISLLFYPAFRFNNSYLLTSSFKNVGQIFLILGLICLILGFWKIIEIKFFNIKSKINELSTLIILIFITIVMQVLFRLL
ncbi:MAG: hypothetical protein DRI94_09810 [Bacteroidetes bacterium]|nr:MAG: hypothetical protein DRI94_09810 [Bacteroidota bacterium]